MIQCDNEGVGRCGCRQVNRKAWAYRISRYLRSRGVVLDERNKKKTAWSNCDATRRVSGFSIVNVQSYESSERRRDELKGRGGERCAEPRPERDQ